MKFMKGFFFLNRLHTISIGIKSGEFGGPSVDNANQENKRTQNY